MNYASFSVKTLYESSIRLLVTPKYVANWMLCFCVCVCVCVCVLAAGLCYGVIRVRHASHVL